MTISQPRTSTRRLTEQEFDAGMDWEQVRLNGGPPCFAKVRPDRLCGRAKRWPGHPEIHEYVSLAQFAASSSLLPVGRPTSEQLAYKLMAEWEKPLPADTPFEERTWDAKFLRLAKVAEAYAVASLPVGESTRKFKALWNGQSTSRICQHCLAGATEHLCPSATGIAASNPTPTEQGVQFEASPEQPEPELGLGESREPLPLSPSEHLIVLHRRFRAAWLRQGDLTDPEQQKAEHEEMIRLSDEIRDLELPSVPAEIESTEPKEPR